MLWAISKNFELESQSLGEPLKYLVSERLLKYEGKE